MREWPIEVLWYTSRRGKTIDWIIDHDIPFFEWMLNTFQNVTPNQAAHYKDVTSKDIPQQWIQDVEPYVWKRGDPDSLYMELCETQDLPGVLYKYRGGHQLELFD